MNTKFFFIAAAIMSMLLGISACSGFEGEELVVTPSLLSLEEDSTGISATDAIPAITVRATGLENIAAGQEVSGASIVYTLSDGVFAPNINTAHFGVSNLPEGLLADTALRTSDTEVTVYISGTPVVSDSAAVNAIITVERPETIAQTNVIGATADVAVNGSITAGLPDPIFPRPPRIGILVTSTGLEKLVVGQEVIDASIIYTLTSGWFVRDINKKDFICDMKLPKGLMIENVTLTSKTEVTVVITGAPVVENPISETVPLPATIPAKNVNGAEGPVPVVGTVTIGPITSSHEIPVIEVTATGLENLSVGQMVRASIRYTLSSGMYSKMINPAHFAVSGLPEGLIQREARHLNASQVVITVTGTPTTANPNAVTIITPATISSANIDFPYLPINIFPPQGAIAVIGTVTAGPVAPATAPTITSHPADYKAIVGTSAEFTVVAAGTAPLNYQWQYSNDGNHWLYVTVGMLNEMYSDATTAKLTIMGNIIFNGWYFRCEVTNMAGVIYSNPAKLTVTAPNFTAGGIYYKGVDEGGTAVKVTNNIYDENGNTSDSYSGAVNVPATVSYQGVVYTVKEIAPHAFYISIGLTSVTLPNGITTIGYRAFSQCLSLQTLNIPASVSTIDVQAFSACHVLSLTATGGKFSVISDVLFESNGSNPLHYLRWIAIKKTGNYGIPNGVVEIHRSAINFTNLTTLAIPASVTSINP